MIALRSASIRLRDGRSISTVSALLLQLVQTSAHDVRVQARAIRKARLQDLALRRQDSMNEQEEQPFLDEKDMEVSPMRLVTEISFMPTFGSICRNCVSTRQAWIRLRRQRRQSSRF